MRINCLRKGQLETTHANAYRVKNCLRKGQLKLFGFYTVHLLCFVGNSDGKKNAEARATVWEQARGEAARDGK